MKRALIALIAVLLLGCLRAPAPIPTPLVTPTPEPEAPLDNYLPRDSIPSGGLVGRVIQDSTNVCVFGTALPASFFGSIDVNGKSVRLNAVNMDVSSSLDVSSCAVFVLYSNALLAGPQLTAIRSQVARGAGVVIEKRAGDALAELLPVVDFEEGSNLYGETAFDGLVVGMGDTFHYAGNVTIATPTRGVVSASGSNGVPIVVSYAPRDHNSVYWFAVPMPAARGLLNAAVGVIARGYLLDYARLRVA